MAMFGNDVDDGDEQWLQSVEFVLIAGPADVFRFNMCVCIYIYI